MMILHKARELKEPDRRRTVRPLSEIDIHGRAILTLLHLNAAIHVVTS